MEGDPVRYTDANWCMVMTAFERPLVLNFLENDPGNRSIQIQPLFRNLDANRALILAAYTPEYFPAEYSRRARWIGRGGRLWSSLFIPTPSCRSVLPVYLGPNHGKRETSTCRRFW